jgi:hypothetical protein
MWQAGKFSVVASSDETGGSQPCQQGQSGFWMHLLNYPELIDFTPWLKGKGKREAKMAKRNRAEAGFIHWGALLMWGPLLMQGTLYELLNAFTTIMLNKQ